MLLPLILLGLAQDADRVEAMMANYHDRVRADVQCRAAAEDEIMVCSRREADQYRVPLVASSNVRNSVPLRTADLTKDHSRLPCGQGAFIAQCGPGFGVTVSTDGRRIGLVERELAP